MNSVTSITMEDFDNLPGNDVKCLVVSFLYVSCEKCKEKFYPELRDGKCKACHNFLNTNQNLTKQKTIKMLGLSSTEAKNFNKSKVRSFFGIS